MAGDEDLALIVHRQVHKDLRAGLLQQPGFGDQPKLVINGDPCQKCVKCTVCMVHLILQGAKSVPDLVGHPHALRELGDLVFQAGKMYFHL